MDDEQLARLIEEGDPGAAAILVSRLAGRLYRYTEDIAPDLGTADREMAVDRALENVVRRIGGWDPARASLETWGRGFVRHALADVRRRPRITPTDPAELPEAAIEVAPLDPPSPESVALTALMLTVVDEGDAALLIEHNVEGLTFVQIARRRASGDEPDPDELNRSAATLRQRHRRAAKRLFQAAADDDDLKHLTEEDDHG